MNISEMLLIVCGLTFLGHVIRREIGRYQPRKKTYKEMNKGWIDLTEEVRS